MSFSFDIKKELASVKLNKECCIKTALIANSIFAGNDNHSNDFEHIKVKILKNECCLGAFLRCAYLCCGSITNPAKEYFLEFHLKNSNAAYFLLELFLLLDMPAKILFRGNISVVYIKESSSIEDLLTIMNAKKSAMQLMEVKILKDVRNRSNRLTNCDTANISKTVGSAAKQTLFIEKLINNGKLNSLSDELKNVAILRTENPLMSLSELAILYSETYEQISRSGINHRLKKLEEIANSD